MRIFAVLTRARKHRKYNIIRNEKNKDTASEDGDNFNDGECDLKRQKQIGTKKHIIIFSEPQADIGRHVHKSDARIL